MLHYFVLIDSIKVILLQNVEKVLIERGVINNYFLVGRLISNRFHDFWEILITMNGHIILAEVLFELWTGDFLFVDEKVYMMISFVVLMEHHVGEK